MSRPPLLYQGGDFGLNQSLLHANHNLAEMGPAFQISESLASFVERKDTIDHRPDLVQSESAVHGFKHIARSNKNPLHLNLLSKDRHRSYLALGPGQQTDQADSPPYTDGVHASYKRSLTADLDNVIHTDAVCEFEDFLIPILRCPVVDQFLGTHT